MTSSRLLWAPKLAIGAMNFPGEFLWKPEGSAAQGRPLFGFLRVPQACHQCRWILQSYVKPGNLSHCHFRLEDKREALFSKLMIRSMLVA
jgi:hypothetical protein